MMKISTQTIKKYNETKYTDNQVLYALEVLQYKSFADEEDVASKIEEVTEFLDENLVGEEGIVEYVNNGIEEGIFFPGISEDKKMYINVEKFARDLLMGDFYEDKDGSVYRCP